MVLGPLLALWAWHFQVRDQGVTGAYHIALVCTRGCRNRQPDGLETPYDSFVSSALRAVERSPAPPPLCLFGEVPGWVDEVHRQLRAVAKWWPRSWESLDAIKEMLELRRDLAVAWEVGNL